ncbi:hypothetical protein JCM8097_008574 [Rhodosporidiobolus ruineniae]
MSVSPHLTDCHFCSHSEVEDTVDDTNSVYDVADALQRLKIRQPTPYYPPNSSRYHLLSKPYLRNVRPAEIKDIRPSPQAHRQTEYLITNTDGDEGFINGAGVRAEELAPLIARLLSNLTEEDIVPFFERVSACSNVHPLVWVGISTLLHTRSTVAKPSVESHQLSTCWNRLAFIVFGTDFWNQTYDLNDWGSTFSMSTYNGIFRGQCYRLVLRLVLVPSSSLSPTKLPRSASLRLLP